MAVIVGALGILPCLVTLAAPSGFIVWPILNGFVRLALATAIQGL